MEGHATEVGVSEKAGSGFAPDIHSAVDVEGVAGIPRTLAFFFAYDDSLGSEAFNLDLQLGYLRHRTTPVF